MNSNEEELLPLDNTLDTGKLDPRFEGIIGGDERQKVESTGKRPWCQVCCLEYHDGSKWIPYATGWIAGRRLIVTAGHNLFNPELDGARYERIRVCPGRGLSDETHPHGSYESSKFIASWEETGGDPSQRKNDYAAIFLEEKLPHRLGSLSLMSPANPGDLAQEYVTVPGYPFSPDFCQQQYRHKDVILGIEDDLILYKTDTLTGQSGAPILFMDQKSGRLLVVGIHAGGGKQANESFGAADSDYSPPPSSFNSGPFMSAAVVTQIERWLQQSEGTRPGLFARIGKRLFG